MKLKFISISFFLFLSFSYPAFATLQTEDDILYNNKECKLETSWRFPSPLEIYFQNNKKVDYPFKSQSTGNYRGHIAKWEIKNNELYLIGISIPDYSNIEPPTTNKSAKDLLQESNKLLIKLFSNKIDNTGKIKADWFSGSITVRSKPVKRHYKSNTNDIGHTVIEYSQVSLIDIKNGHVLTEATFPKEEYWKKLQTFSKYKRLSETEIKAFTNHSKFIERYTPKLITEKNVHKKLKVYSVDDFSLFLTRYYTRPIKVPLTEYAIVKNSIVDFTDTSYTLGSDIKFQNNENLLILEMGASNVPHGAWSDYTGGSIQIIVRLGDLVTKKLRFSEKDRNAVKFINNFANKSGLDSDKTVHEIIGELSLVTTELGVKISGLIQLKSKSPSTLQEIWLDNSIIPSYSVREYQTHLVDSENQFRHNSYSSYKTANIYKGISKKTPIKAK